MKLPFVNSFSGAASHLRYGETPRPERDWFLLVSMATLVLLASVAWNVWTFASLTNGELVGSAAPAATSVNASSLEKAQTVFRVRAEEEARYRTVYRFIDPSR